MIIKKKDGTPFPTKGNAKSAAVKKELESYELKEQDGGWVIEIPDTVKNETKIDVIKSTDDLTDKEKNILGVKGSKTESVDPEDNVGLDDDYKEQEYPYSEARLKDLSKKPKVTYIPKECKNPAFAYRFLLKEKFTHGNMCGNWQIDYEVNYNMKRKSEYRHLASPGRELIRGDMNELILCRMPMEYAEAIKKSQREQNKRMLGDVTDNRKDIHSVSGLGV